MKNFFVLPPPILLIIVASALLCGCSDNIAIEVDPLYIDLGTVESLTPVPLTIKVENKGSGIDSIEIRPSCGCGLLTRTDGNVVNGSIHNLNFNFTPPTREGKFSEPILLYVLDENKNLLQEKRIIIQGKTERSLYVYPTTIENLFFMPSKYLFITFLLESKHKIINSTIKIKHNTSENVSPELHTTIEEGKDDHTKNISILFDFSNIKQENIFSGNIELSIKNTSNNILPEPLTKSIEIPYKITYTECSITPGFQIITDINEPTFTLETIDDIAVKSLLANNHELDFDITKNLVTKQFNQKKIRIDKTSNNQNILSMKKSGTIEIVLENGCRKTVQYVYNQ